MNSLNTFNAPRQEAGSEDDSDPAAVPRPGQGWRLQLLGMWELQFEGEHVHVPQRERRLITCLVLLGSRPRAFLSGLLWPESSEDQAAGNLRSCVWRITHDLPDLLGCSRDALLLNPGVQVDIDELAVRLEALENSADLQYPRYFVETLLNAELLPGWYDDWVIHSQERIRQMRVSALESMAGRFLTAGNPTACISAAMAAVAIDPLRESANRLLIAGHLASGNPASAHRTYRAFVSRLDQELGITPSRDLWDLLHNPKAGYKAG